MDSSNQPKVSFLIPVLNEEKTIRKCLNSILDIDYPQEKKEILLALGKSTDGTNKIIEQYKSKYPELIKTYENPTGNTSTGRKICVENSTGDMLMNYSGHVVADKNLLKVLAIKLSNSDKKIAAVGCSNISPEKQNFIGKVAGIAFSGIMGGKNLFVQNAVFDSERFSDHISFACYRKKTVLEVGNFDPEFWCGQDAELDLRLLKAGYKILYTPETKVYHFKRNTMKSLFRQMYRYGIARAKMAKKHPKSLKVFHLFGTGFIIGIIFLAVLTILNIIPFWVIPVLALSYVLLCIFSSFQVTKKPVLVFASILFYFLIHIGYGTGFLRGLVYGKL